MLDHFGSEHSFEVAIVIRKSIALGIEQIHASFELFAAHAGKSLLCPARRSVIRAANIRVAGPPAKERRDLHVAAQLEYSSTASGFRYQCERSSQARQMLFEVGARLLIGQIEPAKFFNGCAQIPGRVR